VYTSSLPIRAICLIHPILLYLITRTIFGEQYRSLSSSVFIICRKSRYTSIKVSYFPCSTCYGLDGPGIETRWRRDIPHPFRSDLGLTQPPVYWVSGLSRR
jgi:hypothetical protein